MRDFDSSTLRWRLIALVATTLVSGSGLMAGVSQVERTVDKLDEDLSFGPMQ